VTVFTTAQRAVRLLGTALAPYPLKPDALLAANSVAALKQLAVDSARVGFNGQILRIAYLVWLFRTLECTSFIETGTYRGMTARAARALFDVKVFTVEMHRNAYWSSRLLALLAREDGVHFALGDSSRLLSQWLRRPEVGPRPMLYLDAHWFAENPLRRELAEAVRRGSCVAVIDDCRVARDPEFGFDSQDYGRGSPWNFTIELPSFIDLLPRERVEILQPAYSARDETGRRRGTAIALIDLALPPGPRPFVASLFSAVT